MVWYFRTENEITVTIMFTVLYVCKCVWMPHVKLCLNLFSFWTTHTSKLTLTPPEQKKKKMINPQPDCFAHMQWLLVMYLTKDLSLHFASEKCVAVIRDLAFEIMLSICDQVFRQKTHCSKFYFKFSYHTPFIRLCYGVLVSTDVISTVPVCCSSMIDMTAVSSNKLSHKSTVLFSWKCTDWFLLMSILDIP